MAKKIIKPPNNATACPLCGNDELDTISTADQRIYHLCRACYLIHLDRSQLPTPEDETLRYQQHHNHLDAPGYVSFLNKAIQPSLAYLQNGMKVLDYGCGPTPVLAQLLKRDHDIHCHYYDPFFFPDLPSSEYDFIFSTEAFEHFFSPAEELNRLYKRLKTGGYLCVMTLRWDGLERFEGWWYRRDQTHVCFYHQQTFAYISKKWPSQTIYKDHNQVIVLQKL